jgi:hypothetical protein
LLDCRNKLKIFSVYNRIQNIDLIGFIMLADYSIEERNGSKGPDLEDDDDDEIVVSGCTFGVHFE